MYLNVSIIIVGINATEARWQLRHEERDTASRRDLGQVCVLHLREAVGRCLDARDQELVRREREADERDKRGKGHAVGILQLGLGDSEERINFFVSGMRTTSQLSPSTRLLTRCWMWAKTVFPQLVETPST
jgi:hypothetical protein